MSRIERRQAVRLLFLRVCFAQWPPTLRPARESVRGETWSRLRTGAGACTTDVLTAFVVPSQDAVCPVNTTDVEHPAWSTTVSLTVYVPARA